MSGVAIGDVEVGPALLDFLRQVVATDEVGAGGLGVAGLLALGEDGDGDVFAEAVRQRQGAAQLLVGVADVDAEQDVQLDGLVELGAGRLLDQGDRLGGRVGAVALDLVVLLAVSLAVGHLNLLFDVDAHRAGGAGDDLRGGVEVVGVEVGHLALGDLRGSGPRRSSRLC